MDDEQGSPGPVDFRPRRLASRGTSSRARLLAASWLIVVTGLLVGPGIGRLLGGPADPSGGAAGVLAVHATAVPGLGPPNAQPPTPAGNAALGGDASQAPSEDLVGVTVVTAKGRVEVSGTVGAHAIAALTVALEDSTGATQISRTVSVLDPDGGVRPARTRTFAVAFAVRRSLASSGYVAVTAFDGVGAAMGVVQTALGPGSPKIPLKVNATYVR